MSSKAKLLNYLAHLIIVVPFVQTETLRFLLGWLRTFHGNTGQRILSQFHVVAVGAAYVQTNGYAVGIDQQAAFGAALGPVGGIFARLFPPRGVPWSCTRPCSARTNRCLSSNRIPTSLPSRSQKRRRLRPILENGRAPWNQDKTWWHPALSIDSPFVEQRKSHPCRRDRAHVVAHHQSGACFYVREATTQSQPTKRQECASHPRVACHSSLNSSMSSCLETNAAAQRSYRISTVIRIGSKSPNGAFFWGWVLEMQNFPLLDAC